MAKAYKYIENENGEIIITHETNDFNMYRIEAIKEKCRPKGRRTDFEKIISYEREELLVPRKNLMKFDVLGSFITFSRRGYRSVQYQPYGHYIDDDELLDDAGIEVLTYKHYFSGDDKLLDLFLPIKKEDINDEIYEEINKTTVEAVKECEEYRKAHKHGVDHRLDWREV